MEFWNQHYEVDNITAATSCGPVSEMVRGPPLQISIEPERVSRLSIRLEAAVVGQRRKR